MEYWDKLPNTNKEKDTKTKKVKTVLEVLAEILLEE